MAEVTEDILLSVKLDRGESEKQIDSLTKSIVELTNANKKLTEDNKALTKSGQENSKAYVDNAKQIEINKQKVSENTATRKGLIQSIVAEDNSIKSLRVQNAELIRQRDQINTSTDEGKKKISLINAEIDKNNNLIKDNSSALEKQKQNVGGYTESIKDAISQTNIGGVSIGDLTGKITSLINPITGVVAGLGALAGAYLKSSRGAEDLARASNNLKAGLDEFLNSVGNATDGGFLDRFTKRLNIAFINLTSNTVEAGNARKTNVRIAEIELKTLRDLELQLIETTQVQKDREREAENARRIRDNQEASYEDRLKAVQTIKDKLSGIDENTVGILQKQVNALISYGEVTGKIVDGNIIDRELNIQILQLNNEIADKREEINGKLTENITAEQALRREIKQTKDDELTKRAEIQKKISDDKEKADEEEAEIARNKRLRDLEESYEFDQLTLEQKTAQAAQIEAIDDAKTKKLMANTKKELDASIKAYEKETEEKKKQAQIQALVDAAKVEAISNIFRQSAGLAKEGTALAKILGIASATVDTYKAANLALATYPPPFGQIAAGVNVAVGLGNVAKISGVKFARGGISGGVLSGPSHAHGGIPFSVGGRLGFEAEGGEAIINKRSTAMYKPLLSRINQSGGGVPFAVGGIAGEQTRVAASNAESQFNSAGLSQMINAVKIVLVREDYEVKQKQYDEIQQRVQVI